MKKTIQWLIFFTALIGILVAKAEIAHAQSKSKKMTVGELLSKVRDDSRGGKIQTMQKNDTTLPETQFAFKQQPQTNLSVVKPPRSTEILKFEPGDDQAEYEKTLDRQIQELYKLTKKFENSPNRGELWLRLAELYVEKSTLVDSRKQDNYDAQLRNFQEGKTKTKPRLDTKEAQAYNRRAIQLYEWFLRDYPNDEKVSQALFFLGYNYFELNDAAKGASYYGQLTRRYPNSPFVGEAHFALGEYYFENEKWADAYKEYSKLIKEKRHRLHSFSLYKGGWCLFRLGRTEEAIKYLDFIIKLDENSSRKKAVRRSKLENEALRDIVMFFSDIADTKRAVNYFKSLNLPDGNNYIEKLAYYYADKGGKDASRDVFRYLINEDPTSKKAFEYQYQIVQNYFYSKNSPQFKEELYNWINNFKKDSNWAERNKNDQAFLEKSYQLREQTLRNYILQQHQTAQNSRASYSRQLALDGYQLYFQEFSDSSQVADMHFFYAELLYDMNKFEEAATHYTWVAENAPKSKYGAKSAQNLLLSIEKALPKDEELAKRKGDSIEPIPFDPRVEKFLKSAQWYTEKFPNSEKMAEIKFRMGRLYYQSNHFNEAEVLFKEIVAKYPKTKFSEYSANLLLDIYNLKKDFVGLEKMGAELLQNESISSSKTGSDIRNVLERASFKKGQDLETDKKYLESAEQYQAFAVQNPKSELVSMALFNSGVNFERSGKNYEAIQNYKKTLSTKDKNSSSVKPKAQKLLAKLYQDAGQFEESAKLFKQAANDNPKDPLTPNYLFNAAVMYEALGSNKEAISTYNEFLKVNKSNKENSETLYNLAELMRKSNSPGWQSKYREYAESSHDSAKRVAAFYWGGKDEENKAIAVYNKLKQSERSGAAKYIAKIKLRNAGEMYNELVGLKIPADPKKQKTVVDQKLGLVTKLGEVLTETIKLDSADEIVSSLDLLGATNEHIGTAIVNAPVPAGLNDDQKKQYAAGIQKIADPFLKKADDSYKAAVERGRDLDVYNDAYKHALAQAAAKDSKNVYSGSEISSESRLIQWVGDNKQ